MDHLRTLYRFKQWCFICVSVLSLAIFHATSVHAVVSVKSAFGEMDSFFDEQIAVQMDAEHIPGVAVAVVHNGGLIFLKGYGYSDRERQIPVDPQVTLFRIDSITKLFTWTAVMQLAETGKLDLDTDVNHYLDFSIPSTFEQTVTLRHAEWQSALYSPGQVG